MTVRSTKEKKKPTVSVIIASYNSARYLVQAMKSVFKQTFGDFEIVVVDDGSRDKTKAVVERFQQLYPHKVVYVYQDNKGPAAARNNGIRRAEGTFIAILDADDIWLPSKLKSQLDFLQKHQEKDFVFTDIQIVAKGAVRSQSYLKEKGYVSRRFKKDALNGLLERDIIFPSTVMFRRKIIESVGLFNEEYRYSEDYEYWIRIARKHQIACIEQPLTVRHSHETNLTGNKFKLYESLVTLHSGWLAGGALTRSQKNIIKKKLQRYSFDYGYCLFLDGKYKQSRKWFLRSFGTRNELKARMYYLASFLPGIFIDWVRRVKSGK